MKPIPSLPQQDFCLILHGPWGVLVNSRDGSVTAATPAIIGGGMPHTYAYREDQNVYENNVLPALPAGGYELRLTSLQAAATTAFPPNPPEAHIRRTACISDLAYLRVRLPSFGTCLLGHAVCADGSANAWVGFNGRDGAAVQGTTFPHCIALHYPAAADIELQFPGAHKPWSPANPPGGGCRKLHLYAQYAGVTPMRDDMCASHFTCMTRVFGIDVALKDAGGPHTVAPAPAPLIDADLQDLAPVLRQDPPFTCGGNIVIYS
ncbi:MAG: hypothetical protein EPN33_06815 [Acidobacteria bacterium]|nr:MAG: hypothetical protein EPN33_06815 [Acidobacteriota bacterium]